MSDNDVQDYAVPTLTRIGSFRTVTAGLGFQICDDIFGLPDFVGL